MPTISAVATTIRRDVLRVLSSAQCPLTASQISELLGHTRSPNTKNTGWMSTVSTALGQLQVKGLAQVEYRILPSGHRLGYWTVKPERGQVGRPDQGLGPLPAA